MTRQRSKSSPDEASRLAGAGLDSKAEFGGVYGVMLALQRAAGNRAVAQLLTRTRPDPDRGARRSLQRWPAKIAGKNVRLRAPDDDGTGPVVRQSGDTTLPQGAKVEIDTTRTRESKSGKVVYTWVTYNNQSGWVNTRFVRVDVEPPGSKGPRKLQKGPKAGFEVEFNAVYVLTDPPAGEPSRSLLESAQKADAARGRPSSDGPSTTSDAIDKQRERFRTEGDAGTPFPKRTVLFRAPHRTWAATTDTTLRGLSNLEFVGAPLTVDELDSADAKADRTCLDEIVKKLKDKQHAFVVKPSDLAAGLVDVRPGIVLVNNSTSRGGDWHAQLTQATKLSSPLEGEPDWWLAGLNLSAIPILEQLVNVMKAGSYSGSNPKNLFKDSLPKTSVASLLGTPKETEGKTKRRAWVAGMAEKLGVALGETVGEQLVKYSKGRAGQLVPTGFTWRQFFTSLLEGKDLIADWSRRAFGGTEDFGYGMIKDKSLPPDWYVSESRTLPALQTSLSFVWERQQTWAGTTHAATTSTASASD